jgi:hypothetical protein
VVDREALAALFGEVGAVVGLAELLPELPPRGELVERLAEGMARALGIALDPGELTAEEQTAAGERARDGVRRDTRSPGRRAALDSA